MNLNSKFDSLPHQNQLKHKTKAFILTILNFEKLRHQSWIITKSKFQTLTLNIVDHNTKGN